MMRKIMRFLLELVIAAFLAVAGISMVIGASIQESERLSNATYAQRN